MIIRPAQSGDIDAIVALLHEQMNSKIAPERWRRLFTYPWLEDKPDFGRVAVADGRVVGFVGAIHADRVICGQPERLVNICAWYLGREHRGQGAGRRLMADATDDRNLHYMINTSSSRTLAILDAVGFRILDEFRFDWQRRSTTAGAVSVDFSQAAILAHVSPDQRRILADHEAMPVTPSIVSTPQGRALVILAMTRKADRPWTDVLHVENPDVLALHGQAIANAVLTGEDAVMSADARFCSAEPEFAARVRLPVPRFVKSQRLSGHHIDHLYTELQLLGLKLD